MNRNIDIKLLTQVLSIQSSHTDDSESVNFIENICNSLPNITIEKDTYGNIYVTKGESDLYPCVVAHMDTVHKRVPDKKVKREGDILYAFSETSKRQVGIGGKLLPLYIEIYK